MENRTKGDRYANLGEVERGLTDTAIDRGRAATGECLNAVKGESGMG